MNTDQPIVWAPTEWSGWSGSVGDWRLFSVSWVGGARPYIVRTQLPGFKRDVRVAGLDEAKEWAERVRVRAIQRLGGTP